MTNDKNGRLVHANDNAASCENKESKVKGRAWIVQKKPAASVIKMIFGNERIRVKHWAGAVTTDGFGTDGWFCGP